MTVTLVGAVAVRALPGVAAIPNTSRSRCPLASAGPRKLPRRPRPSGRAPPSHCSSAPCKDRRPERNASGRQWFTIRIADTDARQEQGLMFVGMLPVDEGMLFPAPTPRIMNFWMKNTVIPLDQLFIAVFGQQ